MARTALDYSIIKSCAQYAQALMLMMGVAKQVPSFKSTLKDIYPRFVEEGGGEMHIHLGEYGYSLHLTSTENGVLSSSHTRRYQTILAGLLESSTVCRVQSAPSTSL